MLDFIADEERQQVLIAAKDIKNYNPDCTLHKLIEEHKKAVKQWNKTHRSIEGRYMTALNYISWGRWSTNTKDSYLYLGGVISGNNLERACRLIDALYKSLEGLGCIINPDLSINIRGKNIQMLIFEKQCKEPHVLTKQEIKDLAEYEINIKNHSYAWKPNIRKWDHHFSGELCISPREYLYYSDSKDNRIEDKLGRILIDLFEESNRLRIEREAKEAKERILREEQQRKEMAEAEKRREVRKVEKEYERVVALKKAALDWDTTCKIRAFIHEIELKDINHEKAEWIHWAKNKADWLDPTVNREDEILGKRSR